MHKQKKLLIYTHNGGRFGNQLMCYAHLAAFIAEHRDSFDFINVSCWPYAHLVKETADRPLCVFPSQHSRFWFLRKGRDLVELARLRRSGELERNMARLLHYYGVKSSAAQSLKAAGNARWRKIYGEDIGPLDLDRPEAKDLFGRAETTVLCGWHIRGWQLLRQYQDFVREGLRLLPAHVEKAEEFITALRAKYDRLIGVTIRQGDYRFFLEGRYFFFAYQYAQWMAQCLDVFPSRRTAFVIASDEWLKPETFQHLEAYFAPGAAVGTGHYAENLAALSMCDIIMAPPTTFGIWAAFLGNIPLLPVTDDAQEIREDVLLTNHLFDAAQHPEMQIAT